MPSSDDLLDPSERWERLEQLMQLSHHVTELDRHLIAAQVAMGRLSRQQLPGAYRLSWQLYMDRGNYLQIAEEARFLYLENRSGDDGA